MLLAAQNSPPQPVDTHPARLLQADAVRELLGGISDMTLWRWCANETLNFPKPIHIQRRRFWREADVLAWMEAQAEPEEA